MKKRILILSLLSLGLISKYYSQTLDWAKRIESKTINNNEFDLTGFKIDQNNNIIMVGKIKNIVDFDFGPGVNNLGATFSSPTFFMAKYSSLGNLLWVKKIGSAIAPSGSALTIDNNNNIIVVGSVNGKTDVNPGSVVNNVGISGAFCTFLAKYDSLGNYIWSKTFPEDAKIFNVASDSQGQLITLGHFRNTVDFDLGSGINTLTAIGEEGFIARYTSTGSYSWVKTTGNYTNLIDDLHLDAANNIYIAGHFNGILQLDPLNNQSILNSQGKDIGFFAKFASNGNYLLSKSLYCSGSSEIKTIRNEKGNIILSGRFNGTMDIDASNAVYNVSSGTSDDVFLAKYNSSGNFKWGFDIGNAFLDEIANHEISPNGNVFLFGKFKGIVDFNPSSATTNLSSSPASKPDLFLASYDSLGALKICKRLGGSQIEYGLNMQLSKTGGLYLFGQFQGSVDFDLTSGVTTLTSAKEDKFFVKYQLTSGSFLLTSNEVQNIEEANGELKKDLEEKANGMILYPNPSFDVLNIEINNQSYSNNQIKIYDFLGREVSNLVEIQGSENRFQLNTSSLSRGTYFLMISDQHKSTFIKQ